MRSKKIVRDVAVRAQAHEGFVAKSLLLFARAEGIDLQDLAEHLDLSESALNRLMLCRKPSEPHFIEDLKTIASYVGANEAALLRVIRVAESIEALADLPEHSIDQLPVAARRADKLKGVRSPQEDGD